MSTRQCYRHPRGTWIASCADCTAWHLVDAVARRNKAAAAHIAPFPVAPRRASPAEWLEQAVRPAA
jgi:hypothetical protein